MRETIEAGLMAFLADGQERIGAVRRVEGDRVVIYVENAGEFPVPSSAIVGVHSRKVMLDPARLERRMLDAIGHQHDAEDPKLAG